jgi:uncharacterized membrane protein
VIRWYHTVWLAAVFVAYVVFVLLMPPMQSNDEPSHWNRLWSVASGHLTCDEIPAVTQDFVSTMHYDQIREKNWGWKTQFLEDGRTLEGRVARVKAQGNACVYIPIAYVLPALAMLPLVTPYDRRFPAGLVWGYYVARFTNVFLLTLAVIGFLWLMPELATLTLVLYSLPMTIQQGSVYNQESSILLCGLLLLWLWHKKSSLKQVVWLLVVVAALAAMKSTYLVLLVLWAAALYRWIHTDKPPRGKWIGVASLGVVPLAIQYLWTSLVVAESGRDYIPNDKVSPSGQLAHVLAHPTAFPAAMWNQLLDLFGRGHMNGGWTGVFGVLGWADFEIGDAAYYGLILAVILAFAADTLSPVPVRDVELPGAPRRLQLAVTRVAPLTAFLLIIPAVATAMYFVFSEVGSPYIIGVQGRYLQLPYFAAAMLAVMWTRVRLRDRLALPSWLRPSLIGLCMLLSFYGVYSGFHAVLEKYYHS